MQDNRDMSDINGHFLAILTYVFFLYTGVFKFDREFYCVLESVGALNVTIIRSGGGSESATIGKRIREEIIYVTKSK